MAAGPSRARRLKLAAAVLGGVGLAVLALAWQWPALQVRYRLHQLRHGEEGAQVAAQVWLEERLATDALPLFRLLLDDPHPRVRYLSVDTLGRMGEDADLRHLAAALGDPDSEVRYRAAELLPSWEPGRVTPLLAAALRDNDPELRLAAAMALGRLGSREGVPLLAAALQDADEQVVSFAVAGLRRLTGEHFGYRYVDPPEIRQAALERWRRWASSQGVVADPGVVPGEWPGAIVSRRRPAPEFRVAVEGGGSRRLADFRGKVLLLDFFSPL